MPAQWNASLMAAIFPSGVELDPAAHGLHHVEDVASIMQTLTSVLHAAINMILEAWEWGESRADGDLSWYLRPLVLRIKIIAATALDLMQPLGPGGPLTEHS